MPVKRVILTPCAESHQEAKLVHCRISAPHGSTEAGFAAAKG